LAATVPVSQARAASAQKQWTLATLHRFCSEANCKDGVYPPAGLVRDPQDDLFGNTYFGGRRSDIGQGVVFTLSSG
jgi:hypothetical protein